MNNYTMDLYEIKREITTFSKKISKGLSKPISKFVMDMQYGISRSKSLLISEISRSLDENVKIKNTIERLCDNLSSLNEEESKIIERNYIEEMKVMFPDEAIAIFDDTDITKRYGKKFEDLDKVIDGTSKDKEIVSGYKVCEAVILSNNEKQPISVYSKIYS